MLVGCAAHSEILCAEVNSHARFLRLYREKLRIIWKHLGYIDMFSVQDACPLYTYNRVQGGEVSSIFPFTWLLDMVSQGEKREIYKDTA